MTNPSFEDHFWKFLKIEISEIWEGYKLRLIDDCSIFHMNSIIIWLLPITPMLLNQTLFMPMRSTYFTDRKIISRILCKTAMYWDICTVNYLHSWVLNTSQCHVPCFWVEIKVYTYIQVYDSVNITAHGVKLLWNWSHYWHAKLGSINFWQETTSVQRSVNFTLSLSLSWSTIPGQDATETQSPPFGPK